MFSDQVRQSSYSRYWDRLVLLVACIQGWAVCTGSIQYHPCTSLAKPLIYIPCIHAVGIYAICALRHREDSLQLNSALCRTIIFLLVTIFSNLATLGLTINFLLLFIDNMDEVDCDTSPIHGASLMLIIEAFLMSIWLTCMVLWMIYMRILFMKPVPSLPSTGGTDYINDENGVIRYVRTDTGFAIPTRTYRSAQAPITILYSHGNATDLEQIKEELENMRDELKVNVCGYEYPGYGRAEGGCSEQNCYDAARTAYNFLVEIEGISPRSIVIYGRSMGSAMAVHLAHSLSQEAQNPDDPPFAAVILQSPLLSVARTLGCCTSSICCYPHSTRWYDKFNNIDRIGDIPRRILIVHGEEDQVVPCWHGKELAKLCQRPQEPLWVPGAGHNDMPVVYQYRRPRGNQNLDNRQFRKAILQLFRDIREDSVRERKQAQAAVIESSNSSAHADDGDVSSNDQRNDEISNNKTGCSNNDNTSEKKEGSNDQQEQSDKNGSVELEQMV